MLTVASMFHGMGLLLPHTTYSEFKVDLFLDCLPTNARSSILPCLTSLAVREKRWLPTIPKGICEKVNAMATDWNLHSVRQF